MGNLAVVNRSLTQPTTLSLEHRVTEAKEILSQSTNPTQASKAAKQLVGSYAHIRPDNPETFIASIAGVLAQYPLGLVEECVDPRRGVARSAEFLTIAAIVDWCDVRLAFYQALASYVARKPERTEPQLTDDERARGIAAYRGLLKAVVRSADEARGLTFDQAAEQGAVPIEGQRLLQRL